MKTLREILFERHRSAASKLDQIRREAVAHIGHSEKSADGAKVESPRFMFMLRNFIWSLRWHVAGLSAIWFLVLLLNLDYSAGTTNNLIAQKTNTTQILTALRENRRQILELIDPGGSDPVALPASPFPPRRSQLESTNAMA